MENIRQSQNNNERFYSEREREDQQERYQQFLESELSRLDGLYDEYIKQSINRKSDPENYDFDAHNRAGVELQHIHRRVQTEAERLQKDYDLKVHVPNFEQSFKDHLEKNKS